METEEMRELRDVFIGEGKDIGRKEVVDTVEELCWQANNGRFIKMENEEWEARRKEWGL